MIGKLSQDEKANWPKHLPEIIQTYNGTRSTITGYSPHYLLFGYHPRFPIDLHFPTIQEMHVICIDSFVAMLQQCLSEALDEAHKQNVLEACRQTEDTMTDTLVQWCSSQETLFS